MGRFADCEAKEGVVGLVVGGAAHRLVDEGCLLDFSEALFEILLILAILLGELLMRDDR